MRGRRRGFTLIEVLVVIGIIVIIAAMLLPVLSRARGKARQATCSAHLRQIGLALEMYADDCDEQGPPTTGWHLWGGDGTNGDHPGPGWEERIDPYVRNRDIYRCPAYPSQVKFSYFLNTRYWWLAQGPPPGQWGCAWIAYPWVQYPTAYVVAGDCWDTPLLPAPLGTSPLSEDSCDKDNMTYRCLYYSGTPHGNGSNLLYADGHVKFATRYDPQTMTFSPTAMCDWQ
jgi:prepilin-type N-terminal cleavage/methylation domain-containing protein/prepilin-type processing-associated H-X9-DG protein